MFIKCYCDAIEGKSDADTDKLVAIKRTHKMSCKLAMQWERLKKRYGAVNLYLGGSTLLHLAAYWGINLTLLGVEKWIPSLISRFKIQSTKHVSRSEIIKLLKRVLTNHAG